MEIKRKIILSRTRTYIKLKEEIEIEEKLWQRKFFNFNLYRFNGAQLNYFRSKEQSSHLCVLHFRGIS